MRAMQRRRRLWRAAEAEGRGGARGVRAGEQGHAAAKESGRCTQPWSLGPPRLHICHASACRIADLCWTMM